MNRFRMHLALGLFACITPLLAADSSFSSQLINELGPDGSPNTGLEWAPNVVPLGKSLVSPNKKFSVKLTKDDGWFYFVVTAQKSRHATRLKNNFVPVFSIAWTPDSRTIVTVDHAAMESLIQLLHWDGTQWKLISINWPEPKGDYDNAHEVDWKFESNRIKATYIADHQDRKDPRYYRIAFVIDPATGNTSDAHVKPITIQEYRALRTSLN